MQHGQSRTRLYRLWTSMKDRCYNPANKGYKDYGGRGIVVCPEWKDDFPAFREWAIENGYDEKAPRGRYTIERKDNDGPYSPENCRWATMQEQANNKRSNRKIVSGERTYSLKQWCTENGINYKTVLKRAEKRGGPASEEDLESPVDKKRETVRMAMNEHPEMTVREIANLTGFPRSTVQRLKVDIQGGKQYGKQTS